MTLRTLVAVSAVLLAVPSAIACPPSASRRYDKSSVAHTARVVVVPKTECVVTAPSAGAEHAKAMRASPVARDRGPEAPADLPPDIHDLPEPAVVEESSPTGGVAPGAQAAPAPAQPESAELPEVAEGDILTLRSKRIGAEAARVWLSSGGATVECEVRERGAGTLRFVIPATAAKTGPATIIVSDDAGGVLRRLAVKLRVELDDEQLDIERVVRNP